MDPVLVLVIAGGIVIVAIAMTILIVLIVRVTGAATSMPTLGVDGWLRAAPSLEAMGLTKLDAETYMRNVDGMQTLFLKMHPRDSSLRGWLDRPCPGGALEMFLGAEASLAPGERGGSDLARFVAGAVGEVLAMLPQKARLSVKAPEMPGDSAKLSLETPFSGLDQPATLARVLLMLDEAARRPAPAGSQARMPPAAMCWIAAAPSLQALGLNQLDAECFMRNIVSDRGSHSLFMKVHIHDATLRGWIDTSCPGGALEMYLGAQAELTPGEQGRSDLARFVAGAVREVFGALPRGATLTVKAPDMPGDSSKISLETPFTTPEQAAIVARVLLMLDEAAHRPGAPGYQAQMPAAARCWLAAMPSLEAMGLRKLDAECLMREFGGGQCLFMKVDVSGASLRGWIDRPCPGGVLEVLLGAEAELAPGEQGRSELAHFAAGAVREVFAALPRAARLGIEAPEMRGGSYKLSVETPFTAPEQAAVVARVLLMLDQAAQRRG